MWKSDENKRHTITITVEPGALPLTLLETVIDNAYNHSWRQGVSVSVRKD